MSTAAQKKPSPIEVWLSQVNLEVRCTVVHQDESTEGLTVDSLSMRGAQREITGYLIAEGYEPVGRWRDEQVDGNGDGIETARIFKLKGEQKDGRPIKSMRDLVGGTQAEAVHRSVERAVGRRRSA